MDFWNGLSIGLFLGGCFGSIASVFFLVAKQKTRIVVVAGDEEESEVAF